MKTIRLATDFSYFTTDLDDWHTSAVARVPRELWRRYLKDPDGVFERLYWAFVAAMKVAR